MSRRPLLFLSALGFLIAASPYASHAQAPPPSTGSSTGTKIGTIIKDAINVALPNVSKLIDAIFGNSNKADKGKATTTIEKQASASKQASNDKLRQVTDISAELSVVGQYLELTVPASQKVSRMLAKLDNASGTTMPSGIRGDWEDLNKSLQQLQDIKPSEINKVDPGLRLRLLEIRGIYDANSAEVMTSITKNDISGLKSQLRAISALLNSVVAIAGIEIASLQEGLDSVVKSIGITPQGGSPSARLASFNINLDDDLKAAQKTLTKPYKPE